jgi:cell fate regulator YaaT (PSP1 superfamily)
MKTLLLKLPASDKNYELDIEEGDFKVDEQIIINTGHTLEIARIHKIKNKSSKTEKNNDENIKFIKKVDQKDKEKAIELKRQAIGFLPICQERIKAYDLDSMKLLNADLSFDEKKITFYFSADGRIDFRGLVSDLAKKFKKIIRLQQIGARDKAKIIGGAGRCGRNLCCGTFLNNIESVTLDMAKEQDISFGSSKLSGSCGKLMCCLMFELDEYRKLAKGMPEVGSNIEYKKEQCRVVSRSLIKQTYTIENKEGQRIEVKK